MANHSAEEIAESAEGNIKPKHLTKDSGMVFTYLYDGPLLTYLEDGEQPEYIFSNERKGFRITDETGEKTPHHTGSEGKRYLLITDQRLLYVAGCKDGDESIEYDYSEILDIKIVDGDNIEFYTTDKKVYKFAQVGVIKNTVEDAVEYVSEKIENIEQKQMDNKKESLAGNKKDIKEYDEKIENILKKSGQNFTNEPIISHIESNESISTILTDDEDMTRGSFYNSSDSTGIGVNDKHNTIEPRESSPSVYVFTNNRILAIIPKDDEDELISIEYDEVSNVDDLNIASFGNRTRLSIHTIDDKTLHLWMSRKQKQEQKKVVKYIREKIGNRNKSDTHDDKNSGTDDSMTSSETEPVFTTRGKEVKIEGNSREKTNCGRIEVYSDHLKIQQKGRFMSKGWIVIQFDEIVDIQVSSLGKWRFMTKRQDVTVTGIGGPTTGKLKKHIYGYLDNKREELEQKTQSAKDTINSPKSSADEIAKFAKLKEKGVISEEEFQKKKDELL